LHSLLHAAYTGDMKPNDLTESQRIIGLIETGTASRSDVDFLLIHLREDLREGDPVKDIAHCIAHSKRDRGYTYKYVEDFVNKVIEWIQSGGRLVVKVLFPLDDVIEQLVKDLEAQGLTVQRDAFHQQSLLLCSRLGEILDGVTLKLSNTHVIECVFDTASNNASPNFNVRFRGLEHGGALRVYQNTALAFPVFLNNDGRH